ncbi:hypothetical protein PLEOSDRAFT_1089979 [Pleurotus ostreatus PC15]|uniref:Uncharacterized protein n=1 Tax=Pleurotus ostreatus (strain PC15) TaxID=1137138 RepID=A0A067NGH8_PLEO1|nr:hypothetical protein PLEOSDRAFT_1089979 [Pleurotus ostreatus PC15]
MDIVEQVEEGAARASDGAKRTLQSGVPSKAHPARDTCVHMRGAQCSAVRFRPGLDIGVGAESRQSTLQNVGISISKSPDPQICDGRASASPPLSIPLAPIRLSSGRLPWVFRTLPGWALVKR